MATGTLKKSFFREKGYGFIAPDEAQQDSAKSDIFVHFSAIQMDGHIKDEFFRGRTWPDFESFKADLDAYIAHWNTTRRQVKLKGLTPEEFRNQPLAA